MPSRREAERKKLEHELSVFLARGGVITKLKPTDRVNHTKLSCNERILIDGPWFGKGV